MTNEQDCVDLGLACVDICKVLDRGMSGKNLGDLNAPVRGAMDLFMA